MITSVTGVVLAGGKSSRMGRNKALLPFENGTLLGKVIERMQSVFSRVILSVHQAEAHPDMALPQVPDHYAETGPMGAIASLLESGEHRIFCVACDMPFLNPALIEFLCEFSDCDAVLPVWHGRIESLHALYSDALLPEFQRLLAEGRFKVADALLQAHVRYVNESEIKPIDPKGESFRNVNTPDDYSDLLAP